MTVSNACSNEPDPDGVMDLGPAIGPGRSSVSGRVLDLREQIALAGNASEEKLVEWLCADQIRVWQAGQRIPAEAYLALHPAFQAGGKAAFEVVYSEFMLRESLGESPCLEEFTWRFPKLADRLQRQFAFHRVLSSDEFADEDRLPAATSRGCRAP